MPDHVYQVFGTHGSLYEGGLKLIVMRLNRKNPKLDAKIKDEKHKLVTTSEPIPDEFIDSVKHGFKHIVFRKHHSGGGRKTRKQRKTRRRGTRRV